MAIDRRRPKWIGWIPAAAMSIIIIAVVITTMVLMAGGLGQDREPTAREATDRGASLFTDDGLRYIQQTREINLDLRNPPLEAAALGLPEDGDVTLGQYGGLAIMLPYTVSLRTPMGAGLTRLQVHEATLATVDGQLAEVRSSAVAGAGYKGALDLIRERAEEFGYTVDSDRINAGMGDAVRAGESYSHTVGPGEALGATTVVELTCDESAACAVVFKITPGVG
ncbi:hypothetical protein [Diaminobutyricimonas sp. LJ205]|uniref:hypothetical protein n=1 Tax=Diaminobutyricimonas sp. LJ205 TaxID=2683590 RepID=UPI0012F47D04|nr:hypothetical protein [Diaminobutyricimonas sp. LJ205]